jgi:N-acetyl-gamma-glutamyl-phosphate reductase
MISVGIIGGAGYTAGELIRLLQYHPHVYLQFVHSQSQAGKAVTTIHQDLVGECELYFTDQIATTDVLFLCSGHGKSKSWLKAHPLPAETLLIDLSSDFRLDNAFVYGLPELNRTAIQTSRRIANPGCFATAIQLGLLPLAAEKALQEVVNIHAITGSTGAGQSPQATTHFSWRANNMSVYKPFQHQHLAEIGRSLRQLQGPTIPELAFLPLRGDFTRGIFSSIHFKTAYSEEELVEKYTQYYEAAAFTHVIGENPHLKQVVNTNKCILQVSKHQGRALVISIIDNLLKGASGQAIQNMNIALGLPESAGLELKAVVF